MKKLFKKMIVWTLVITFLWPNIVLAKTASFESKNSALLALRGQEATTLIQESTATEPGVQIIESNEDGVVLELVTPDFHVAEALSESGPCDLLSVTGYGEMDKSGWPRLPVSGTMLGLPPDTEPELSILSADFVILPGNYTICPVPQPIYDVDLTGVITYQGEAAIPDAAAYAANSFYPSSIVEVAATGWIRNQWVAQLRFHPFQYNPATGVVKHYTQIRVQVRFGDKSALPLPNTTAPHAAAEEDAFAPLLAQIVANYDLAERWQVLPASDPAASLRQIHTPATSQPGYKLTVDKDGLYQVSYTELAAAGLTVAELDPRTFRLHTQGSEVALSVPGESDGIFDPDDALIFYGQKMNTMYTDANVYWLTWGSDNGLRMAELDGTPTGSGVTLESFRTTQRIEQNKTYQSFYPSGIDKDRWYWSFIWATAPTTANYTTTLSAVAAGPISATVRGLFKGYDAAPQHHTLVYLNGNLIVDAVWAKQAEYFFEVAVPTSFLVEGTNTLTINAPMDRGITGDYFLVNWFEIDYDRAYAVAGDSLRFDSAMAGTWEYALTGFTTATVQTFDVTTPTAPIRILNPVIEPEGDVYTVRFEQTLEQARQHLAATPAQFKRVRSIAAYQPADLRAVANGADYIIITHSDFYTDVQPLADYRAAQGLRARVVDVQAIYDEFSYGIFDPVAIRDFLAYAYAQWTSPAPAYVLLMGDGHYDFKNYSGRGETNYVPPFLADVDPWIGEVAADNRYVCVNGTDNFPDMHLGRLPVKTAGEVQAVVNKILEYETNPASDTWNQNVLFVSDNPDTAGNFYTYSDAIANGYLPAPYVAQKVYYGRTHTNATTARTAIINAINAGQLIVNYVGHGAVTYWASEQLFRRSDVSALSNTDRLPMVVAMACMDGYYIYPSKPGTDFSSTAEAFVRAPAKGAIAVWSATGMGTAYAHDFLNKGLFRAIFSDDITELGPATLQGKLYLYTGTGWYQDQIDTYLLFGDPASRLNVLPADVSLTQTVNASEVALPGDDIVYTLSFTNTGPATAHHIVISNVASSALVDPVIAWTGATIITRTGSSLVWDVSDLAAGQSGTITITASISETFSGLLVNSARIDTSALDSDPTNNAADSMATAVYVYPDAPTAVELTVFTATPLSEAILLEWETASELDTLGFNLYRAESVTETRTRLNSSMIPVQSPGEVLGAVYAYADQMAASGATYVYWVEALSLQGAATLYGPVAAAIVAAPESTYQVYLPMIVRTPEL